MRNRHTKDTILGCPHPSREAAAGQQHHRKDREHRTPHKSEVVGSQLQ